MLAQHCEAAGLAEQAVDYWLKAGRQALAHSAMAEAVAQLRKGLAVLAGLPDGPQRQQQELRLQAALASALSATKGWATADVDETNARVRALAAQLDRPEYLAPLIASQWSRYFMQAEHRLALPLGQQLEQIGEVRNDSVVPLMGRFMHGMTRFWLGEFVAARAVLERSMGYVDNARRSRRGSIDPYAATLANLATTLACLGYLDRARSRMNEALSEARRLRHALTLAHVLDFADLLNWITDAPMAHVEELLTLSTEHGFRYYSGWALAHRGRSLLTFGQAQEGLGLLTQGLAELRAAGGVTGVAGVFIWLAEAHALLGQSAEERNCVAEAARIIETTEERAFEAELLHRVPGDLLKAAGDRSAAERHYHLAIAVAERQGAKLLQLRASTSLARLWREQGKCAEARDLLAPIYHWFTEGFDASDLKNAKALLDELA